MVKKELKKSVKLKEVTNSNSTDNVDSQYELFEEKRFLELENKVDEMFKNPMMKKDSVHQLHELLISTNKSIKSLAEVLRKISTDTSFDEKEETFVRTQLKPLILSIKEIREQNETIATGMINIIDRLNDLQREVGVLKNTSLPIASQNNHSELPPLSGGPVAPFSNNFKSNLSSDINPSDANFNSMNSFSGNDEFTNPHSMNPSFNQDMDPNSVPNFNQNGFNTGSLDAQPLSGIPPMEKNGLKKKFNFF